MIDWTKLENEYISTDVSVRKIAEKYKLNETTVFRQSKKRNWVQKKQNFASKVQAKVMQKIENKEVDKKIAANEKHTQLFDKGLEVAELLLNQYIEDLKTGKKKTQANAYNLDFVMKAIANAQKGQRISLKIDTNDDIDTTPEINVIEGLNINKI